MAGLFVNARRRGGSIFALIGAVLFWGLCGVGCGGGSLSTGSSTSSGNVTATAETNPASILVTWTGASLSATQSFVAYNVYRNGSAIATLSLSSTTYTDSTAAKATTLTYTTVANGSSSQSESNTVTVNPITTGSSYDYTVTVVYVDNTIAGQPVYHEVSLGTSSTITLPTGATSVSASESSTTAITVTWTDPTIVTGQSLIAYNVYRDGQVIASEGAGSTTYVDSTATVSHSLTYSTVISGTNTSLSSETITVSPVSTAVAHTYTVTLVYLNINTNTYYEVLLGTSSAVTLPAPSS